jgi:pimeloyl-ACP methyl ester carboxylesterase
MDGTFHLADGRTLGYAEQGDPEGRPVLMFHGLPGSRLTRHPDGRIAERLGLRVITFDRPGIGLSTPKPGRGFLDWAGDVAEFADAHELDRFGVIGWSGGTPYALATGHVLPERVEQVVLVAPVVPLFGTRFRHSLSPALRRRARVGRALPWLVWVTIVVEARMFRRDPERALERAFAKAPASDRRVLEEPALRESLIASRREAYRQGPTRVLEDALLYLRPWDFDPAAVRTPVRLWHGEDDATLAPAMGRYLAEVLADCEATFVAGEGHMICITRWEEILQDLAGRSDRGAIGAESARAHD